MTRLAFLILVSTACGFYIPTNEEKLAAWSKLTAVCDGDYKTGLKEGLELVMVNPIWRHGDRGPTESFAGDVLVEDDWDFGGGGYGELSPIGMQQHYELGQKLWTRYAENDKFLSSRYRAKEVYARSTDKNRTLISAMSNFAGMYSRASAIKGTDYPDLAGWPTTFVPVPIHTEPQRTDYIGDATDTYCPRGDDLWDLAKQHPEYVAYDNKQRTQQTLQYLRYQTGADEATVNFDNVYLIRGGMLCESIHFADNFSTWYPWYTEDVKQRVGEIDNQNIDFQNGIFGSGEFQGYDLTVEIPTVRGGPILNEVVEKARGVLDCYATNKLGENTRCTEKDHFLSNLKYFVISGHDTSIAAYLTVLEAKPYVMPSGGYSSYSSAVITEFFIDTKSGGNERYFRVLFHDDADSCFRVITPFVTGCDIGSDFCKIGHLQALADKYSPPGGIEDLCMQRVTGPAVPTTTKAPPPPATSTSPTTTNKPDNGGASSTVTVPTLPPTTTSSSFVSFLSASFLILIANILF